MWGNKNKSLLESMQSCVLNKYAVLIVLYQTEQICYTRSNTKLSTEKEERICVRKQKISRLDLQNPPRVKMSNIEVFMGLGKAPELDLGCPSFFLLSPQISVPPIS